MDYEILMALSKIVSVLGTIAVPLLIFGIIMFFVYRKRRRERYLLEQGTRGKAVVKKLGTTGMLINDVPVITMDLEVSIPNIPTYTIHKRAPIPMIYYPRIQPGMTIDVAVDTARLNDQKYLGVLFE